MNAKISVFFICVEVIIYLLLYNLHDCTFESETVLSWSSRKKEKCNFATLVLTLQKN